ncbi:MAG: formylglycine-generating enzyme family protein [Myxococcota bacterium]|nr:formylglycine-generating enzyme family protein [Myxococcota bacterium]
MQKISPRLTNPSLPEMLSLLALGLAVTGCFRHEPPGLQLAVVDAGEAADASAGADQADTPEEEEADAGEVDGPHGEGQPCPAGCPGEPGLVAEQRGLCHGLRQICDRLTCRWVDPEPSILSGYEAEESRCDGQDNDCDGETDEPLTCCLPGPQRPDRPAHDRWVVLCPGEFVMGSPGLECGASCRAGLAEMGSCADPRAPGACPGEEAGRADDELQHRVVLSYRFRMQATELGQQAWSQMGWQGQPVVNPARFPRQDLEGERPVETVSWWEALAYANWRSQEEGLGEGCYELVDCQGTPGTGDFRCVEVRTRHAPLQSCPAYRLPTEAEWEYAARAGLAGAVQDGASWVLEGEHDAPALDGVACYGGNSGTPREDGYPCGQWPERQEAAVGCAPAAVASRAANAWGLYDMQGNVAEWVWDGYWLDYGAAAASRRGDGAWVDPVGPLAGTGRRATRGGSWGSTAALARLAARWGLGPTERLPTHGFRLVQTLP